MLCRVGGLGVLFYCCSMMESMSYVHVSGYHVMIVMIIRRSYVGCAGLFIPYNYKINNYDTRRN